MRITTYSGWFLVLFSLSISALADSNASLFFEGGKKLLLATQNDFTIQVDDQVTGGCLPYPSRLKDAMEISLRRNGLAISSNPMLSNATVYIRAFGRPIQAQAGNLLGCAVHLDTEILMTTNAIVRYAPDSEEPLSNQTLIPVIYPVAAGLYAGPKDSMQSTLQQEIKNYGDSLFLEISRAQEEMTDKFPTIMKRYEADKADQ